jgi:hypothetical protein
MAKIENGTFVPFINGIPSVKALVIGISQFDQYILQHDYTILNEEGNEEDVRKIYYRDCWFIEAYCRDCVSG